MKAVLGLEGLKQDATAAIRGLARSPGFTALVVGLMALGIGGATTIYAALDSALIAPPAHGARRNLTWLTAAFRLSGRQEGVPLPLLDALVRARGQQIAAWAAYDVAPVSLAGAAQPVRLKAHIIAGDYFALLTSAMAVGRPFAPAELQRAAGARTAVVAYDLWRSRLGGDPNVVGRTIHINGEPFTIIGVAPRNFSGPELGDAADLWLAFGDIAVAAPDRAEGAAGPAGRWRAIVEMRDGVGAATVAAGLAAISAEWTRGAARDTAAGGAPALLLTPIRGTASPASRPEVAPIGLLVLGIALMALAITTLNVATLQLARSVSRVREVAVRLALGATRGRVLRHLMMESLFIAALGGALGLVLQMWLGALIAEQSGMQGFSVGVTWRTMAFVAAVTVVAGLGAGLLPAFHAGSRALSVTLSGSTRSATAGRGHRRLQGAMIAAQLAVSQVLVFASLEFVGTLARASRVDPGFSTAGMTTVSFDLQLQRYSPARRDAFQRELVARLQADPGVATVALANVVPLSGVMVGISARHANRSHNLFANAVSAGYFSTLGIEILEGRPVADTDQPGSPLVAVLDETAGRAIAGPQSPVGKTLFVGDSGAPVHIVGVARNAKYDEPGEDPVPMMYLALSQRSLVGQTALLVRARSPHPLPPERVAAEVQAIDPALPVFDVATMESWVRQRLDRTTAIATMLSAVGAGALALAAVGLFGVTAFTVRERRRELAIRQALGASAAGIRALVLRDGIGIAAWGAVGGAAIAAPASIVLGAEVFGLDGGPWVPLLGSTLLLAAAVLGAASLAARGAIRAEPASVLSGE